jgi:glycosyltransferase involved in cell wall biosynthesis
MNKEGYIPKEERKKILLMCDDIRMTSGVSTMAREIVVGTAHYFNWVNMGGAINHPDQGKRFDLNDDTNRKIGITDSSVYLYPLNGYGDPSILKQIMDIEKPDAIMFFTDPRYWTWLFQMEHEIRSKIPMIYLNIWDDLPYPMYNKSYYESCDGLLAISKQTENINRVVLGDKAKDKVIKYVPHGINENDFFPITTLHPEYLALQEFKKSLYKNKEYDFTLLYNARNIRRKSVPDLMLAWKIFIDGLPIEKAEKCVLVMHTQIVDENGTDLNAVKDMLFGYNKQYNIIFDENRYATPSMNLLYNATDGTALISSNEGWGLSLTEAMMCGKPIIATVTGGMQDQMGFRDENDELIKFTEEFGSNHKGKYKDHGSWVLPVYPSNSSIVGSVQTPYIFDDRAAPEDIAESIKEMHKRKIHNPEVYDIMCNEARKWATSDESMQSARWMAENVIDGIEKTFTNFKPRKPFELIKVETPTQPKHYVKTVIAK